ncbi:2-nitropropane dioxygenase [Legionella gratiana]|uniref:2-nitropropane dioxygenase n=1 Tax=Legionella gratiana TaxID=45066 RepID=A0A378JFX1_9GAMM|nr:2-nitropropane dioxygenase [Legionella gratiana]STX45868.1 2-nitropropane dioxygenase [Legionella gratiana]
MNILNYPIQNVLTTAMRKKAKEEQNIDFMSMWSGQSAQLCRKTSAREFINALVFEVEASKLIY